MFRGIVWPMDEKIPEKKSGWQSFWEMVRFALLALLIVVPIRAFVAEPFIVSGSSMVPTFEDGDYLVIDKLSYELGSPERYDVAVFRYPNDPSKFFIKRIIGLPNETIDIAGGVVTIRNEGNQEGFILEQPFVENPSDSETHFELKDNEYFVMGDNRRASSDSRYWGAVNKEFLTGRALVRLLPFNKINILPGNYQIEK
ncbi:MAG: Signal peptidase I [Parcubacteria group bacterium GW2011_GWA1_47_11]|uniref:Signal peptidase I n=1 Tax=Candidatus Nomurabacteria bacterium GW2011_GWB1_47_6 TaxID=1618749 RepID=A0A0G1SZ41_9BACT|nr:MAG: Signal peptidase I [Parcubacteria group bacterium GW2011_GWA1_47_11]KKU74836.1 MAG: Signal peptidase I [Candidatus Nomurabacteria bacterium GW2011_GWB1_47_6]